MYLKRKQIQNSFFTFYAIISKVSKINGYGIVIMFVSVNKEEGEDSYG